jgi:hypothetical protein
LGQWTYHLRIGLDRTKYVARGTFFKRFCQIGQLGGDAIPVV